MLTPSLLLLPTLLVPPSVPASASGFDHDHAALTEILKRHVHGDEVDYAALEKERGDLRAYLDQLEAVSREDHDGWSAPERYAFWINVYNAYTLDVVVDRYPVRSIKDIGTATQSVWKKPFIPLGHLVGKDAKLTLDAVEHELLRPIFPVGWSRLLSKSPGCCLEYHT